MDFLSHLPPYRLARPATPLPLVFDSPHSGHVLPPDFGFACAADDLRIIEDCHVDSLFGCVPALGGSLLAARIHRAYIDLNRSKNDLDQSLMDGPWPERLAPSRRSEAGIGLIHRTIRPGVPVYDRLLSPDEIRHRIDTVWRPYHAALKTLLDESHSRFGQVWHLNCHAMPSAAAGLVRGKIPDIVLGNRDGTSCSPCFTDFVYKALENMGYRVSLNDPYKGVELVRRYANPTRGRHSLQIEISKALYLDEKTLEPSRDFKALERNIEVLCQDIAGFVAQATRETLAAD